MSCPNNDPSLSLLHWFSYVKPGPTAVRLHLNVFGRFSLVRSFFSTIYKDNLIADLVLGAFCLWLPLILKTCVFRPFSTTEASRVVSFGPSSAGHASTMPAAMSASQVWHKMTIFQWNKVPFMSWVGSPIPLFNTISWGYTVYHPKWLFQGGSFILFAGCLPPEFLPKRLQ